MSIHHSSTANRHANERTVSHPVQETLSNTRNVTLRSVLEHQSSTPVLITLRSKPSGREGLLEIARKASEFEIEQFGRLIADFNERSKSSDSKANILNFLREKQSKGWQLEADALITELIKNPAECMLTVCNERPGAAGTERHDEYGADELTDLLQKVARFVAQEMLDPLLEQAILKVRGTLGMARLPAITTLGVERAELIEMLARHTDRLVFSHPKTDQCKVQFAGALALRDSVHTTSVE